jgi:hypothetical protein
MFFMDLEIFIVMILLIAAFALFIKSGKFSRNHVNDADK